MAYMNEFLRKHCCLTLAAFLLGLLCACSPESESGLEGQLLFQGQPLASAQVEIYLKADKDRSVQPFAVAVTDAQGHYQIALPEGQYFVIGKKRESTDDGRTRMLMAESPVNPHRVTHGKASVAAFSLREMGREGLPVADASTGISGQVVYDGVPVARAYLYIYAAGETGLTGPSYGEAVQADQEGRFSINLPAGRYALVARKRADGKRSGVLSPGDLNAQYPGNPIEVRSGERLSLETFALAEIDADVNARRQSSGVFDKTDTSLNGRVVNADGDPVSKVYVFAYLDSRMVGKPVHMSAPSDTEGQFELFLSDGGTYYVGARSAFGGPLEPGEWVGTFDGKADHSVVVARGAKDNLGTLVVREFW